MNTIQEAAAQFLFDANHLELEQDIPTFENAEPQAVLATLISCFTADDTAADITAHRLLSRFGSLPQIFTASHRELCGLVGLRTAAALKMAYYAALEGLRHTMRRGDLMTHYSTVNAYLKARLAAERHEHVLALFLDNQNRLMRDEVIAVGSPSACSFSVRQIFTRAIEIGCSSLLVSHQHPSGSAKPSQADITMTQAINNASRALEITFHDHYIVTDTDLYSMRAHGNL